MKYSVELITSLLHKPLWTPLPLLKLELCHGLTMHIILSISNLKVHALCPHHWRLNDSLLSTAEDLSHMVDNARLYFSANKGSVQSPVTLWEAHKVTMRGCLIELAACRKKDRMARIAHLQKSLINLDRTLKIRFDKAVYAELTSLTVELNSLLDYQTEKTLIIGLTIRGPS